MQELVKQLLHGTRRAGGGGLGDVSIGSVVKGGRQTGRRAASAKPSRQAGHISRTREKNHSPIRTEQGMSKLRPAQGSQEKGQDGTRKGVGLWTRGWD